MHHRFIRATAIALCLGACAKTETPADTAAPALAPAVDTAPPPLTDANIVAILDNANALDSAAGAMAVSMGTSKDVKDFGTMMMRDHHALRVAGQDLASKLGVTPQPPAGSDNEGQLRNTLDLLHGAAQGAAFDSTYINNEVVYHAAVLETATKALGAATNAELKELITTAAPNIQAHLDKAKAIQAKQRKAGAK